MSKTKKFKLSLVVFAIIIWFLTMLLAVAGQQLPLWRKILGGVTAAFMYGSCVWLGFRVVRIRKDKQKKEGKT